MTRILCLWLPNWPIQRIVRSRPELKGRPIALVVSGPRGGEVAACCSMAVAQNVRPGMPMAEARSLARGLIVAKYDAEADRQAFVKCAEACERFSPRVAIEEGPEPESLLLDISGLEHLSGNETRLVEAVRSFFVRRGFVVRLGVADTIGAAWAAAHFEKHPNDDCHSTFALPVQSLRISEEAVTTLRQLGIETVGQLAALPREALAARFGEHLLRRWDQLTGAGREVIEPRRARPPSAVSHALEESTSDRGVLLYVLGQLVEHLARQLKSRNQGAMTLACTLRVAEGQPMLLRIGLLQPSACARQLLELVELHLEAVQLTGEVDHVELRATVVGRLGERQGELFANCWPMNPHQLAVLVNRLTSRLGHDHVLRAESRASAVPERTVRWGEVVRREGRAARRKDRDTGRGEDKQRGSQSNSKASPDTGVFLSPCLSLSPSYFLPPRPLLLYPKPQAMEVVCVAPDGPPRAVWLGGRRESIVMCIGPERIESLWWRGPSVRRDYYRVATDSGSHLWLFRHLGYGGWFLHGVFA